MLTHNHVVFDDYITPGTDVIAHTSDVWDATLGGYGSIAIGSVVDEVTSSTGDSGSFYVAVVHSADRRNWFVRASNQSGMAGTQADITVANVAPGGVYVNMFSDACRSITFFTSTLVGPLLPFVKLSVYTTVVRCHVRIHAACRGPKRW